MPDRVNPEAEFVETAIEETRQFLEQFVDASFWAADPEDNSELRDAIEDIQKSRLPEKTKLLIEDKLFEALRTRSKKPTRRLRDGILWMAAKRLEPRFHFSRNDETDTQSASGVIKQALDRLGVKMAEKTINNIVLK